MNRPDELIKELENFSSYEYGDELSIEECHIIADYIKSLEKSLDKACELIKEAVSQDCTIFDEVIEDDYMWRTELEEWKEWCLKDVD